MQLVWVVIADWELLSRELDRIFSPEMYPRIKPRAFCMKCRVSTMELRPRPCTWYLRLWCPWPMLPWHLYIREMLATLCIGENLGRIWFVHYRVPG